MRRIPFYHRLRRLRYLRRLRRQLRTADPLYVVIGGGTTALEGWFKTDIDILDVTKSQDWRKLFRPQSIDRLLAEHVFEHLSEEECRIAFAHCYHWLKPGGLLRIAVPDGYRRDEEYVAEVKPPKDGHKMLFTIDTLPGFLEGAGFQVTPLEFFDAKEDFHTVLWDEEEGFIGRSFRFDKQEKFKRGDMFYTSLILDARKI